MVTFFHLPYQTEVSVNVIVPFVEIIPDISLALLLSTVFDWQFVSEMGQGMQQILPLGYMGTISAKRQMILHCVWRKLN